jgi:hypothetical protein
VAKKYSQRTLSGCVFDPCKRFYHPGDSENPDTIKPTANKRWKNFVSENSTSAANDFALNHFAIIGFYPLVFIYPLGIYF